MICQRPPIFFYSPGNNSRSRFNRGLATMRRHMNSSVQKRAHGASIES